MLSLLLGSLNEMKNNTSHVVDAIDHLKNTSGLIKDAILSIRI